MNQNDKGHVPVPCGHHARADGNLPAMSTARSIVVNGRDHMIEARTISHAQLVSLAYPEVGEAAGRSLTITYEGGPLVAPQGILTPHQRVPITDGEKFIVARTHAS